MSSAAPPFMGFFYPHIPKLSIKKSKKIHKEGGKPSDLPGKTAKNWLILVHLSVLRLKRRRRGR